METFIVILSIITVGGVVSGIIGIITTELANLKRNREHEAELEHAAKIARIIRNSK